jgi:hypothetical protein
MSSKNDELFREVKVLSQSVSRKNKFFAVTACMNPQQREMYGFLEMYELFTKDKSLSEFKKLIQIWGRSIWGRTELTDLGFALGENVRSSDYWERGKEASQC